jgi:alkyl hydroperoxide reductase subunit F
VQEASSVAQDTYDTIIVGGGPAGVAAAVYAARKKLRTLLITKRFGGQSIVSSQIENWIGEISITGHQLAQRLEQHVRAQKGVEIRVEEEVIKVNELPDCTFEVKTDKEGTYRSKTLIVASGGRQKHLEVPGEERLGGKGVAYCTTCDAPFFEGLDVAVVGGGDSALEGVIDLAAYARRIYLFIRGDRLKADPVNEKKATSFAKLQIIKNVEVEEILGEQRVTGLRYREKSAGNVKELEVKGVFVAIGNAPNSDFVKNLVDMNRAGEILIDFKTAETSRKGIFAAGNVTNDPFKQNNIAAGDGVRAAISAYTFILDIKKYSPCAVEGE